MPLSAGTLVAGYRIEGVLGSGGMGTVYIARHPTLPRNDALKILSAELSVNDRFRARFIREADLAATLNHPNIVTVYDRGQTDDGHLWIAMEYVDGLPADQLAGANRTPARIVRIITDVARALDYAHSRRVLHRDVKPANFLISGAGAGQQEERTLLADFGIARALDDATSLTATGSLVTTADYAAPEAVQDREVDHRADSYALGCSLFELLTGRTPYDEVQGIAATLIAHVVQPIPPPTDYVPDLPPAIDDVIARALAKDPADRFQSAGALAAATAAALTGGHATPDRANVTRPWTTPPRPVAAPPVPPPSPQRRRRSRGALVGALAIALVVAAVVAVIVISQRHNDLAPYQPQTLNGTYGAVSLQHRPLAVAALGPGDPDAVLSLGVQPVLIGGNRDGLPNWLQTMVHSSVPVSPGADAADSGTLATLAAAKPDLIIDTADIDKPTYDKLSAIAPTLTRPADTSQDWTWQTQLSWIATALGRSDAAKKLLADAAAQQSKMKSQHPAFDAKSITAVNYSDAGSTVAARVSAPTNYLEGLGFTYNTHYRRAGPGDPAVVRLDPAKTDFGDVVLLLRTDKAAGGGGYGGLPALYSGYRGVLVIVDDPATITALDTGGPAATAYLNGALVNKLASQLH
ncbi:serine/threonine-protein kinase [Mycobacterium sp.]|uniref:serine/threonine-protein kinase n=1 Tax=Mycobacterium sp. TaxID=1785 RepID=UPI002C00368D|nr:serine/threonine-protein kinase [Mycobacterium sp.]HTQ18754.1 serine/threonine-protein kinase [Mycobacterium sp.]